MFGIVVTNRATAGNITVSDDKGGMWTTDITELETANGVGLAIASAPNHPNGGVSTVFTPATTQVGGSILAFAILEYSGIKAGMPVDVSAGTFNFGTTPSTPASAATSAANELVLAAIFDSNGGAGQTFTAGGGETSRQNPVVGFLVEDKDSGGSGSTPASTWSSDHGFIYWTVAEVIYKLAGAAPPNTSPSNRAKQRTR
jgi:hypothetical protein